MNSYKFTKKRFMAFLLSMTMILSLLPFNAVSVLAAGGSTSLTLELSDAGENAKVYKLVTTPNNFKLLVASTANSDQKKASSILNAVQFTLGTGSGSTIQIIEAGQIFASTGEGKALYDSAAVAGATPVIGTGVTKKYEIAIWDVTEGSNGNSRYAIEFASNDTTLKTVPYNPQDAASYIPSIEVDNAALKITGIPVILGRDDFHDHVKPVQSGADAVIVGASSAGYVTNAVKFAEAVVAEGSDNIVNGDILVVMAEDQTTIKEYALSLVERSNDATVTAKTPSSEDYLPGITVDSLNFVITVPNNTDIDDFKDALGLATGADMIIVASAMAANAIKTSAQFADAKLSEAKSPSPIVATNVLVVMAEDKEIIKSYSIKVLEPDATQLEVTTTNKSSGKVTLEIKAFGGGAHVATGTLYYRSSTNKPTPIQENEVISNPTADRWKTTTVIADITAEKNSFVEVIELDNDSKVTHWGASTIAMGDGTKENSRTDVIKDSTVYYTDYIDEIVIDQNQTNRKITNIPIGKTGAELIATLEEPVDSIVKILTKPVYDYIMGRSSKVTDFKSPSTVGKSIENIETSDILVILAKDNETFGIYELVVIEKSSDATVGLQPRTNAGFIPGLEIGKDALGRDTITGIPNGVNGTQLLASLTSHPTAADPVVLSGVNAARVTDATLYETVITESGNANQITGTIVSGYYVVIKAQNGNIGKYILSVLPEGSDVDVKAGTDLEIDGTNILGVQAGTTVSTLISNLYINSAAEWIITSEDTTSIDDQAKFNAAKADAKNSDEVLATGDFLVVISGGTTIKIYKILIGLDSVVISSTTFTINGKSIAVPFGTTISGLKAEITSNNALLVALSDVDAAGITTYALLNAASAKFIDDKEEVVDGNVLFVVSENRQKIDTYTLSVSYNLASLSTLVEKAHTEFDGKEEDHTAARWSEYDNDAKTGALNNAEKAIADKETNLTIITGLYKALDTAMKNLNTFDTLKQVINLADEIKGNSKDYDTTSASWKAFDTAYADAEKIIDNASDNMINFAINNLREAMDKLERTTKAVRDALAKLLEDLEEIYPSKETEYTPITWAAFKTAYLEADAAVEDITITEAKVLEAVLKALEDTYDALDSYRVQLGMLIVEAEKKVEANYTSVSWNEFDYCLSVAKLTYESTTSKITAVITVMENLKNAVEALKEKSEPADQTALEDAITDSKLVLASANGKTKPDGTKEDNMAKGEKYWLQADVDALEEAIADAQAILDSYDEEETTQAELDEAVAALEEAVETFKDAEQTGKKEADLLNKKLAELIATVTADYVPKKADYTDASWKIVEDALTAAEETVTSTSEKFLNLAIEDLQAAIDSLVKKIGTAKAELTAKVEELESIYKVEEHTTNTWTVYNAAITKAKAAIISETTTAEAIKEILEKDLVEAVAQLESYREVLAKMISEVEEMDEKLYTVTSWTALINTVNLAKTQTVPTAAIEAVKSAIKMLEKAISELVIIVVNTEALEEAIASAEETLELAADKTMPDVTLPEDVNKGETFWLETDVEALVVALEEANEVFANEEATQEDVDATVEALLVAVEKFEKAMKTGTKEAALPVAPVVGVIKPVIKQYDGTPIDGLFLDAFSTDGGSVLYDWYWESLDVAGAWGYIGGCDNGYMPAGPSPSDPGMYGIHVQVFNVNVEGVRSEAVDVYGYVWIVTEPIINITNTEFSVALGQPINLEANVTTDDNATLFYLWHRADWTSGDPMIKYLDVPGNAWTSANLTDGSITTPGVYVYQLLVFSVRLIYPDAQEGVIGNGIQNELGEYQGTWSSQYVWVTVQ